jgi:hypothetical protein
MHACRHLSLKHYHLTYQSYLGQHGLSPPTPSLLPPSLADSCSWQLRLFCRTEMLCGAAPHLLMGCRALPLLWSQGLRMHNNVSAKVGPRLQNRAPAEICSAAAPQPTPQTLPSCRQVTSCSWTRTVVCELSMTSCLQTTQHVCWTRFRNLPPTTCALLAAASPRSTLTSPLATIFSPGESG